MELRPYQFDGVGEIRQHFREGSRRVLYQLSTGGGKTVAANYIISNAVAKGGRPLFLAARRELVHQASNRIDVRHGVILSGDKRVDHEAPCQVASVQTMLNRSVEFKPTLIFLDECAHSTARTHQELLSRYPDVPVVGLTATPVRQSGMGLGDYFTSMVQGPGAATLMDQGWLCRPRHLVGPKHDTPQKRLFGSPLQMWLKEAKDRATIAFSSNVEESIRLVDQFNFAGIPAAHVDGKSDDDYRDKLPGKLSRGELKIVSNFAVYVEGIDIVETACVIIDLDTTSIAKYLQMCGRGLRPHSSKQDCVILDHGGNLWRHGRVDQDRVWNLTTGRDVLKGSSTKDVADTIKVCPLCFLVAPDEATHCSCGYKFFAKKRKTYRHIPGTLQLAHDDGSVTTIADDKLRKDYERFLWQQRNGRKKDGTPFSQRYAWFRFKTQFGFPPRPEWG